LADAQKYKQLVEERFKMVSKSEEEANIKVLKLLEDIEVLTSENKEYLTQLSE